MIYKHPNYKNGYVFAPSSTDSDLQEILETYTKFTCIICNRNTLRNFVPPADTYGFREPRNFMERHFPSDNVFVINNKIADGCFFINGAY